MPEDRDGLTSYYLDMRRALRAVIDELTDDQRNAVIDDWTVAQHLTHIAAWDELRASEVMRISAGFESAWRMIGEQDAVYSSLVDDLRRGHSFEQALWELEKSRQRLLDAIAVAPTRGLDPSLYGEAGLRSSHEAEHTEWIMRYREPLPG